MTEPMAEPVPLRVIAAQWTRLGCIGFGGPPAHIALLRKLVVDDRGWLDARGRAAEKYRADFTEHTTVYIADSTRDVEAAGIGGARSIGVASGRSAAGELRDAGADLVLDDLADTEAVLAAVDRLTVPVRS